MTQQMRKALKKLAGLKKDCDYQQKKLRKAKTPKTVTPRINTSKTLIPEADKPCFCCWCRPENCTVSKPPIVCFSKLPALAENDQRVSSDKCTNCYSYFTASVYNKQSESFKKAYRAKADEARIHQFKEDKMDLEPSWTAVMRERATPRNKCPGKCT